MDRKRRIGRDAALAGVLVVVAVAFVGPRWRDARARVDRDACRQTMVELAARLVRSGPPNHPITCPATGRPYRLRWEGRGAVDRMEVSCPSSTAHGSIRAGVPSWWAEGEEARADRTLRPEGGRG